MAVFLGCLEYTLEEGPRWDWFGDDTIRATGVDLRHRWRCIRLAQPDASASRWSICAR